LLRNFLIVLILFNQAAFGQLFFFGRNKVQYNKFEWKILKTAHFNIYYYGEDKEIAEIGAGYAEEMYTELKVKLNEIVTRQIPLIFYNTHLQFQQTNTIPGFISEGVGGFFEFIKGRVVIPYTGSLEDFRHVVRHELVHVFMASKLYRELRDHRISTDISPPLWFTEGLAEYLSTKPDAQAEMVLRDAIISGYFYNLENISQIYGTFLMYKEGQNFLEFIEQKYGKEIVPLILDNFWMYSKFSKLLEYTLGKSIEEIDSDWEFYLKKKYYPLMANYSPIENATRQLTDFGYNFSPVHFKDEGKDYIYFVANRNGYSSLYRLELKNESEHEENPEPELILRGEKSEELESFHLFQSSIDISKNGIIAFITKSGAADAIHLFSVKDDKIIEDFQREDLITMSSPKFSHDGNKVTFQAVDRKGFSDIYLFDIPSDSLIRLTNDYYDDQNPSFGLTDSQVIFSSDRTAGKYQKKYNLFSFNLDNHQIEYVTYLDANCFSSRLSPDKKVLLFASDYDGVRNIYKINVIDNHFAKKAERVTSFITSAFDPDFINDTTIIFSGFEKFFFNLYSVSVNPEVTSPGNIMSMQIDSSAGVWTARKYISLSKKEKLEYQRQYTLDYAAGQVSTAYDPIYGTRGGAVFVLSDLFGDDNYLLYLYNTAEVQSDILKSFNVSIQKYDLSKRTNYGFGVFNFSGRRYDITQSDEYFYERSFGGFFLLDFPISKFKRIESSVTVANSDKSDLPGIIERKALLVSNTISYVMDNSLWGPTGPLDGTRARLLFGYTGDVQYSNVNYFTVIADYRHYFRLGFRTALAFRSALFYNEGKEARRYFMGGSWDLRGWDRFSIRGEKMWISSIEFRFPLIDEFRVKFPFLGLSFFGIRGAAFFDAGNAWDKHYAQTLGSIGAGLRFNLFGVLALRYDIGKKIEDNFSHLQPKLFYQFFFGWDF
jgi:Omp85 superfamily domain